MRKEAFSPLIASLGAVLWLVAVPQHTGAG
jgi:hypothetical protein